MSGVLLPFCSVFFSGLLLIIFFSKKRLNLFENRLYSQMIVFSFVDSLMETILQLFVAGGFNSVELKLIPILNKINMAAVILFTACLLMYTLVIVFPETEKRLVKNINIIYILYMLCIIIMFLGKVTIIEKNGNFSSSGSTMEFAGLVSIFNLAGSIIIALKNIRKKDRRLIPIYTVIFMLIFLYIITKINPYLIIISITITFIDYIMYHTIENPDLKVITELEQAKTQAEKYSNDKAVFLFNMSQQIKEPLRNIERITNQIGEETDINLIKEELEDIKYSSQRLQYIVNDSLDVSVLDAKNLKLTNSKYNIKSIIEQVSLKVKDDIKDKDIKYTKTVGEDIPDQLYGDSIRIKQLFNTLLFNAVKYTEKGFIELTVSSIIKQDVCRLIIKVEDSGTGIKKEMLEKLFEKHDTEELTTERSTLTLDTLKKMINYIGGTIMVQSEVNKGTEFTVILDQMIVEKEESDIEKIAKKAFSKTKQNILLISNSKDDELTRMIDRAVYNIDCVQNGEDGLNMVRNTPNKYSLIFIDEDLDKLDALSTFRRMKQLKDFSSTVVLISDKSDKKTILRYLSLGFNDVLLKPIKIREVDKILDSYIIKE